MEITYKLHDLQYQIFNDPARFVIVSAGRRFGKTVLAVVKMLTIALRTEKALVWYIAPTYKQAKMIAWKMLLEMTPANLIKKKNEVDLLVTLVNGSEICLKGADNEDSLRGVGLDYVVLDEYGTMKPNVWQEIIRPMLTDRKAPALFIGTPKGKNHFWELWMKGQRKDGNFSSYQAKTEQNPYIPRSEIVEAKTVMNERYFRQEFEASFEDYTGLVWPEFKPELHVVKNPEELNLQVWFESIVAIDTAISGTTAALKAVVDDSGTIYITNEFYEQNKRVSEVADAIRDWKPGLWYMDPAAKIRNVHKAGSVFSLFDEYADNGIVALPAENDVNAGINRVAEYFKAGKIQIFPNCKNLLFELERYHWSEEKETSMGVVTPKPYKSLDHACDAFRYLVMSRTESKNRAVKEVPRYSEAWYHSLEPVRVGED